MEALVTVAATRARRRLGLVLPQDAGWIRAGASLSNRWSRLRGDPFRFHVHPTHAVLEVARAAGLDLVAEHRGLFWQLLLLERPPA
jgi:hypothetical protein